MNWDPVVRREDAQIAMSDRFHVAGDVREAYIQERLPKEVMAEQEKLRQADVVVTQFPLWWYGMPAILKGWFDRVFISGFAFGANSISGVKMRYEQGPFREMRALTVVIAGDRGVALGPRGKSGHVQELLFGLLHGTFAYTGMSVLPPWLLASADFIDDFGAVRDSLITRLDGMFDEEPIPYRPQFSGQYVDQWELSENILPGKSGLSIHIER
jgi:NAD(P)H dehydrogenase (quinone)